jgi:hypothetical protein
MQDTQAFAPAYRHSANGSTQEGTLLDSVTVAATNGSATAGDMMPVTAQNGGQVQLQIANLTSVWVFVNWGRKGVVVAATVAASYPVAPGSVVVVSVDSEVNAVSVISLAAPASTTSVIFTRGVGL